MFNIYHRVLRYEISVPKNRSYRMCILCDICNTIGRTEKRPYRVARTIKRGLSERDRARGTQYQI